MSLLRESATQNATLRRCKVSKFSGYRVTNMGRYQDDETTSSKDETGGAHPFTAILPPYGHSTCFVPHHSAESIFFGKTSVMWTTCPLIRQERMYIACTSPYSEQPIVTFGGDILAHFHFHGLLHSLSHRFGTESCKRNRNPAGISLYGNRRAVQDWSVFVFSSS